VATSVAILKRKTARAPEGKKVNPAQNIPVRSDLETKTIKRTVTNPFTGKDITRQSVYNLPKATDIQSANAICGHREDELIFWFNYGRSQAARNQVFASLEFDFGDENLNKLYKSFESAVNQMAEKDDSDERREELRQMVLNVKKFTVLREKMAEISKDGLAETVVNFDSEVELKKPSGIRGRQKKEKEGEDSSEESETAEVES
jgi:hypothetical protein